MKKINPKKLLPAPVAKNQTSFSQKFLVPASGIKTKDFAKVEDTVSTPQQKELKEQSLSLKRKFISLTKLFGEKTNLERKKNRQRRIELEKERRQKREEEKETGKTTFDFGTNLPKLALPRVGFLDTIKRFLLYGLLGFAIDKIIPIIPSLMGMVTKLQPAFEFFKNVTVGIVGGIVNFIDASYKAYDFVKGKVEDIIGPDRTDEFNEFTKNLNTVLNGALLAATAVAITAISKMKGPLGKFGLNRGKVKGLKGAAVGFGLGAVALRKIRARELAKRVVSRQQREAKIDSLRARRDAQLDVRKETLKERLKENALRKSERESRRTPEQVRVADREERKQTLRDRIKSSERNASSKVLLKKAEAAEELQGIYKSDAARAKLRRGVALQKGQFFPKSMMPTRATRKLKKYRMPFEEAVLSKPYGYNPNIVRFSEKFPTGYVDFRYGGRTKRMSQSSARYLSTLIENALAAERTNLPFATESRKIATEFFKKPEKFQSQVRKFAGLDIDQMNKINRQSKRKFTKEDVTGRRKRPKKPTPDVSPTAARIPTKLRGFAGGLRGLSKGPLKALIGPFIGGIVDFVVSVLFGDSIGEAAAGAIGATFLGAVGGFLGNIVLPGIGGFVGATLGGFGGDYFFREMYKKLFDARPKKDDDDIFIPKPPAKPLLPKEDEQSYFGVKPVLTSRYGEMRGNRPHLGTDIAVPTGTPLVAVSNGDIIDYGDLSRNDTKRGEPGGWGNFIVYQDIRGLYHLYAHLNTITKKSGSVKQGEQIATVGSTGRSSNPHLHWEIGTVWTGSQMQGTMDPLSYYSIMSPFALKGGKRTANVAPPNRNIASGLDDMTDYEQGGDTEIALLPIVDQIETMSQSPSGGGGVIVLNSNAPSRFAPALIG